MTYYGAIERDNAFFAEDSNFCPDCHETWSRCRCGETPKGDFYAEPDPISEQILKTRGAGARGGE